MDDITKYQPLDEFLMETEDRTTTVSSEGLWVRYEDHKKIVEALENELEEIRQRGDA